MKSMDMVDKLFIMAADRAMAHPDPTRKLYGRILRDIAPGMTRELERHADEHPYQGFVSKADRQFIHTYITVMAVIMVHLTGCLQGAKIPHGELCRIAKTFHDQLHLIDSEPVKALGVSHKEVDSIVKEFFPDEPTAAEIIEALSRAIKT